MTTSQFLSWSNNVLAPPATKGGAPGAMTNTGGGGAAGGGASSGQYSAAFPPESPMDSPGGRRCGMCFTGPRMFFPAPITEPEVQQLQQPKPKGHTITEAQVILARFAMIREIREQRAAMPAPGCAPKPPEPPSQALWWPTSHTALGAAGVATVPSRNAPPPQGGGSGGGAQSPVPPPPSPAQMLSPVTSSGGVAAPRDSRSSSMVGRQGSYVPSALSAFAGSGRDINGNRIATTTTTSSSSVDSPGGGPATANGSSNGPSSSAAGPTAATSSGPLPLEAVYDSFVAHSIVSFLVPASATVFMQLARRFLHQFPVPQLHYEGAVQDRYPAFFDGANIGKGGFGVVYRVYDRAKRCYYAVKVQGKRNVLAFAHWRKLNEEVALMEGLRHPNIASLVDTFQTPDSVVLVYEVGEGGTLRRALETVRKKSQDHLEAFVAHAVQQLARALKYLYEQRRIIHRDIKQENVVLSRDFSRVMLIDFGLAEVVRSDTQRYVPCGTHGFAPPEVVECVNNRHLRFAAKGWTMHQGDVFSLGVVAFALLSGTKPLKGTKFQELHREIQQGITCVGGKWNTVSKAAIHLIQSMLHNRWELRITCDQIETDEFITTRGPQFLNFIKIWNRELTEQDQSEANEFDFLDDEEIYDGTPIRPGEYDTPDAAT